MAGSDVRYSGVASSSAPEPAGAAPEAALTNNVNVKLDVTTSDDGSSWTTPLTCSLGLLGLGGPDPSPPSRGPFKGDGNYYAIQSATVQMRKNTCNTGYTAAVFRSAVLHEVGHTLGLGHPDQAQSTHSTTTSADWNSAVMRSLIPNTLPDTPQKDDNQAVQYYYPGAGGPPCTSDATTFCANANRFKVQVQWTSLSAMPPQTLAAQATGAGQAVALTADTGYFWFFSPNNVEMVIKVVDGRALNNHFWVFAGGLTNVNVVITVTDTQTGAVKVYVNPQSTAFQPIQDTSAFSATVPEESLKTPDDDGRAAAAAASVSAGLTDLLQSPRRADRSPAAPSSPDACTADATTLCLNSGRFQVRVTWTSTAASGAGQAVSLTGDTGYYWFFSQNNVEMVIKVVDGRPLNGKFWVFAGGLTNVNVVITVTDTQTGAVKVYVNPQSTAFQPIQDTSAF